MAEANSTAKDDPIRCVMTDAQYHDVVHEVDVVKGLLELLQPKIVNDDSGLGVLIGVGAMKESLEKLHALMEAAWVRTREARHDQ